MTVLKDFAPKRSSTEEDLKVKSIEIAKQKVGGSGGEGSTLLYRKKGIVVSLSSPPILTKKRITSVCRICGKDYGCQHKDRGQVGGEKE